MITEQENRLSSIIRTRSDLNREISNLNVKEIEELLQIITITDGRGNPLLCHTDIHYITEELPFFNIDSQHMTNSSSCELYSYNHSPRIILSHNIRAEFFQNQKSYLKMIDIIRANMILLTRSSRHSQTYISATNTMILSHFHSRASLPISMIWTIINCIGLSSFIHRLTNISLSFDKLIFRPIFFSSDNFGYINQRYSFTYRNRSWSLFFRRMRSLILNSVIIQNEIERNERKIVQHGECRLFQHPVLPWEIVLYISEISMRRRFSERTLWLDWLIEAKNSLYQTFDLYYELNKRERLMHTPITDFYLRTSVHFHIELDNAIKMLTPPQYNDTNHLVDRIAIRSTISHIVDTISHAESISTSEVADESVE